MTGDSALREALPRVRRARGFRLYDSSGRRYLDLFQDGGAAILGHRSAGTVREMKDALSRGLAARLPSRYEGRLLKILGGLFPSYRRFGLYSCLHSCLEAVSRFLGASVGPGDVRDPAVEASRGTNGPPVSFWRPFLERSAATEAEVLIPLLPQAGAGTVIPACFKGDLPEGLPGSDLIPPYILCGTLRAMTDLSRCPSRDPALLRKVEGAPGWRSNGPYLEALCGASDYPSVFRSFLDEGVLLCPVFPGPSILPGEASAGEIRKLARLFHSSGG
jgi:hypothetical protein